MHTLSENVAIVPCNSGGTIANNAYLPASGSFIDVSGFKNFAFLVVPSALADGVVFSVFQDTSATATGSIKAVTGATVTTVATTDIGHLVTIEVDVSQLDGANGFKYVTLKATGIAGTDAGVVLFQGFNARSVPITQVANYTQKIVVAA